MAWPATGLVAAQTLFKPSLSTSMPGVLRRSTET